MHNTSYYITFVNLILALYYLYSVIANAKILLTKTEIGKVQIFSFSILFTLYILLVGVRFRLGGEMSTTEIAFWKVFDFVLIMQGLIYFKKVVK